MTEKNKGRSGGDRPTPSTSEHLNPTGIDPVAGPFSAVKSSRITRNSLLKKMIFRLAVWGLIPPNLTIWIIQRGGAQ